MPFGSQPCVCFLLRAGFVSLAPQSPLGDERPFGLVNGYLLNLGEVFMVRLPNPLTYALGTFFLVGNQS